MTTAKRELKRKENEERLLNAIATLAIKRKTGARGLRSIVEASMLDVMFDLPSREESLNCSITLDTVINNAPPEKILDSISFCYSIF